MPEDLQQLCESGSLALRQTDYLRAEKLFEHAETVALTAGDFDSLSRLYFPLQEARRQKRQRCGDGTVRLDLTDHDLADPETFASANPHGQFLVAGDRSTAPAERLRAVYQSRGIYAEVFLAARVPLSDRPNAPKVIAVFSRPADLTRLPRELSPDRLVQLLPPHTVILPDTAPFGELSSGSHPGTPETFAVTMALWERLHLPYLAHADAAPDLLKRLHLYRDVLTVDYACELAHQRAAAVARELARTHG
jgi:hypothetical protein